jgi:hypothetical protein
MIGAAAGSEATLSNLGLQMLGGAMSSAASAAMSTAALGGDLSWKNIAKSAAEGAASAGVIWVAVHTVPVSRASVAAAKGIGGSGAARSESLESVLAAESSGFSTDELAAMLLARLSPLAEENPEEAWKALLGTLMKLTVHGVAFGSESAAAVDHSLKGTGGVVGAVTLNRINQVGEIVESVSEGRMPIKGSVGLALTFLPELAEAAGPLLAIPPPWGEIAFAGVGVGWGVACLFFDDPQFTSLQLQIDTLNLQLTSKWNEVVRQSINPETYH